MALVHVHAWHQHQAGNRHAAGKRVGTREVVESAVCLAHAGSIGKWMTTIGKACMPLKICRLYAKQAYKP